MYLDNPSQTIIASDAGVTRSEALTGSGGVFYVKQAKAITITEGLGTSEYIEFRAPGEGSFMYSESAGLDLSLARTLFKCQLPALDYSGDIWPKLTAVPATHHGRGGAFYVKNANTISSDTNIFEKCYLSPRGGVFSIFTSASMTDTNS